MGCPNSEYGTHRCVRCDSEVEDHEARLTALEELRAEVRTLLEHKSFPSWFPDHAKRLRALAEAVP